jgi:hypothetical protein
MPEIPESLLLVIADGDCGESKLLRVLCLPEKIDLADGLSRIPIPGSPPGNVHKAVRVKVSHCDRIAQSLVGA